MGECMLKSALRSWPAGFWVPKCGTRCETIMTSPGCAATEWKYSRDSSGAQARMDAALSSRGWKAEAGQRGTAVVCAPSVR